MAKDTKEITKKTTGEDKEFKEEGIEGTKSAEEKEEKKEKTYVTGEDVLKKLRAKGVKV